MQVYLCRHGETEWNLTGQHTSRTDLPLLEQGIKQGHLLRKKLQGKKFAKVFSSPLHRSIETCKLAGFDKNMIIDPDFSEWDYGEYEGKTTAEIRKTIPDWNIFQYGAKGGETVAQVQARAKRAIDKIRNVKGDVLVFSHGHFTRVLGAVWVGLDASAGRHFALSNASLCILGYEREAPVFDLWNDNDYLINSST